MLQSLPPLARRLGAFIGEAFLGRARGGSDPPARRSPLALLALAVAALVGALVAGCGGGAQGGADPQQIASVAPAPPGAAALPPLARGTLLQERWSAYPRLIRLAHQADAARNGRIVASLTQNVGGVWQAAFHASDDGGASFAPLGALLDGGFAKGLCCGTLFELPRDVGTLPAGTLLYSASEGADVPGTVMEHPLYRSDDGGASFARMPGAVCGRSAVPRIPGGATGVWEPEFLVAADGSLACVYSDESEPGKSQVLKLTRTSDGATWSAPRVIVAGALPSDRPGMAVVRMLPGGRYLMSFESCSSAQHDCALRLKFSDDGLDWGPLGDLGARPRTAAGQFFRHAPTHAWMAVPGQPQGAIVLVGQLMATSAPGVDDQGSGRVLMVGSAVEGAADWRLVDAPIGLPVAPLQTDWCQNYSTALLPSADGTQLLMLQTDLDADGRCLARFGQGSLAR